MWRVQGEFPHYRHYPNKARFMLNCDKPMTPISWEPPINWSGFINMTPVKFVQTSYLGSSKTDYDWTDFPEDYQDIIPYIVEAIDEAMRTMD